MYRWLIVTLCLALSTPMSAIGLEKTASPSRDEQKADGEHSEGDHSNVKSRKKTRTQSGQKQSESEKPPSKKSKLQKSEAKKPQSKKRSSKKPTPKKPAPKKPAPKKPAPKKPAPKKPTPKKPEPKQPEASKPELKKPEPTVDRSKEAATDLAKVDRDYWLQGEYMGRPDGSWWTGAERVGLQVIALGDGRFDALILRGGLPGAGWDAKTKIRLSGQRQDNQVLLVNDDYQVAVFDEHAVIRDRQGTQVAHLEKWHRISSTQDAPPPPGAVVLFDGTSLAQFRDGKLTEDGLLSVGAATRMPVGDFVLHLEFRTPYMPFARGQGRGNSGVYIQQRYEVQVLDSFGLDGADNECGGLYKQKRPAVNMCFPPLSWQTYDISFTAARFDSTGRKLAPARITVLHNGEPIHYQYELKDKTGGGKAEGSELLPILLQNHGNPVAYRNIWIIPGSGAIPQVEPIESGFFCESDVAK